MADVLIADARGKARHDFRGKLSYSWPKLASQTRLNRGDAPYDPLFAYGYGLSYGDRVTLARLSEVSGVAAVAVNSDRYLADGKLLAPWRLVLRDAGGDTEAAATAATTARGSLSMSPVDANGVQGGGRAFVWTGEAQAAIVGPPTRP